MNALTHLIKRYQLASLLLLTLLLAVVLPLTLDIFRLNLVGKYLTYAFVAIGLVMVWGYGGVLSLGQGVFFGLGGYAMAMFLKLEASDPITTKIQSTPGHPRLHGLEPDHRAADLLAAVQEPAADADRRSSRCRRCWPGSSATRCSSGAWAVCTSPSSPRRWR